MATAEDLSDVAINQILVPYRVHVTPDLCHKIRKYIETLLFWNRKIALTTITLPEEIVRVHFGESFFLAAAAHFEKGRVADIGTGAGFPGIPLRMVLPGAHVTLVESVGKKAAFLSEVIRKLDLDGIKVIRCRMEEIKQAIEPFELVTARALGSYEALLRWARGNLSIGGRVALLIGTEEVDRLGKTAGWVWQDPIKVPESEARFVFLGSPQK